MHIIAIHWRCTQNYFVSCCEDRQLSCTHTEKHTAVYFHCLQCKWSQTDSSEQLSRLRTKYSRATVHLLSVSPSPPPPFFFNWYGCYQLITTSFAITAITKVLLFSLAEAFGNTGFTVWGWWTNLHKTISNSDCTFSNLHFYLIWKNAKLRDWTDTVTATVTSGCLGVGLQLWFSPSPTV